MLPGSGSPKGGQGHAGRTVGPCGSEILALILRSWEIQGMSVSGCTDAFPSASTDCSRLRILGLISTPCHYLAADLEDYPLFFSAELSLQTISCLPLWRCIICWPGLKKDLVSNVFSSGLASDCSAVSDLFESTE